MRCTMDLKKLRVVFMGSPVFASNVLKKLIEVTNVVLVVSQPDAYVGRKKVLTASPVKKLALEEKIEVFTPERIKSDYDIIKKSNPDIIITCAYGQMLPKELLELPRFKSINVHASLLPKLRGGAPIQRAIMNGEKETGITIMYMDEKMDTGNIISNKQIKIDDSDTYDSLHDKLSTLGIDLLIETLPSIVDGTNPSIKQNEEEATYAPLIDKVDEKIDFNKTSLEVYNKIRGLNSNPGAFMMLNGDIIKVYNSRIGDKRFNCGVIGQIYKDGIGIGTLDGEIILTEIKPAGKNRLLVKDYLNGIKKENILGMRCNEEK